ncbi:MAG: lipoate--protein ligase family protein [Dehalococcoidia bacterium]
MSDLKTIAALTPESSARSPWRLLPFSRLPADEQMAFGDAMLTEVQTPALRWRQIVPEALILGHGQRPERVNFEACRLAGIGVSRRASGGTAVLSGPDLLGLDVVLPAGHPLALADITRSYVWLGEALAVGLRSLGVEAATVPPDEARAQARAVPPGDPLRLACYATLSPYEIVAGGRKLVGLAQARRRSGTLLQAGILLQWHPERLVPLLAVPPAEQQPMIDALQGRAVGLDELGFTLTLENLLAGLTDAISAAAGVELLPAAWTAAEQAATAEIRERYAVVDPRPGPLG